MKENSETLAQQAGSAKAQIGSGATIELVTPGARMDRGPIICPPNCLPNCPPSCPPRIFPGPSGPCYPNCLPELIPPRPPKPN